MLIHYQINILCIVIKSTSIFVDIAMFGTISSYYESLNSFYVDIVDVAMSTMIIRYIQIYGITYRLIFCRYIDNIYIRYNVTFDRHSYLSIKS